MLCKWDASIIMSLLHIIMSLLHRPLLLPIITHFSLPNLQMKNKHSCSRSLNILTVREPTGLSSRHRLILLASHRMVLTGERKNSIWIAREIEIFSIFAGRVPTLVPQHNSRIRVFLSTICWSLWSINIYETFGAYKFHTDFLNFCWAGPHVGPEA